MENSRVKIKSLCSYPKVLHSFPSFTGLINFAKPVGKRSTARRSEPVGSTSRINGTRCSRCSRDSLPRVREQPQRQIYKRCIYENSTRARSLHRSMYSISLRGSNREDRHVDDMLKFPRTFCEVTKKFMKRSTYLSSSLHAYIRTDTYISTFITWWTIVRA